MIEVIRSTVVKWRWAYDGERWHYAYTVLAKNGNDYIVIDRFICIKVEYREYEQIKLFI